MAGWYNYGGRNGWISGCGTRWMDGWMDGLVNGWISGLKGGVGWGWGNIENPLSILLCGCQKSKLNTSWIDG